MYMSMMMMMMMMIMMIMMMMTFAYWLRPAISEVLFLSKGTWPRTSPMARWS